jgi:hypothetical protein
VGGEGGGLERGTLLLGGGLAGGGEAGGMLGLHCQYQLSERWQL